MRFLTAALSLALPAALLASPVWASGGNELNGALLSALWVAPFVCMLLSIAILPLATPHIWHHHYGKIAAFWALAFAIPCAITFGAGLTVYQLLHTFLLEYVPFLILLLALFTVAGGIRITGNLTGTPAVNTGILAAGTLLASLMGTTGAAMLLIRPLLRANSHRTYQVHSVVFFIFLVANIGGSLTPLGDPPLFLGFLQGVSFFWTLHNILPETLLCVVVLLSLFFIIDTVLYKREGSPVQPTATSGNAADNSTTQTAAASTQPSQWSAGSTPPAAPADAYAPSPATSAAAQAPSPAPLLHTAHAPKKQERLGIDGAVNLPLLFGIVGAVLMSGLWKPGVSYAIYGVELELQNLVRDALLLGFAYTSWKLTTRQCRHLNDFSWGPIEEVAKLFAGIFVSMIPAIAILKAGEAGALAPIIRLVTHDGQPVNAMYFWLTGILSSFLDNAPTYLVFFNTAGGDAAHLMRDLPETLAAISAGAVFMGANSYIGNAPNFMVRSIAEDQGVQMPSFFGYMAWSCGILVPCFLLVTWIFFG